MTTSAADLSVASPALRAGAASVRRGADALEALRFGELVPAVEDALPDSELATALADALRACDLATAGLVEDARAFAAHVDAVADGLTSVDESLADDVAASATRPA
jgi:hypothetical protein